MCLLLETLRMPSQLSRFRVRRAHAERAAHISSPVLGSASVFEACQAFADCDGRVAGVLPLLAPCCANKPGGCFVEMLRTLLAKLSQNSELLARIVLSAPSIPRRGELPGWAPVATNPLLHAWARHGTALERSRCLAGMRLMAQAHRPTRLNAAVASGCWGNACLLNRSGRSRSRFSMVRTFGVHHTNVDSYLHLPA